LATFPGSNGKIAFERDTLSAPFSEIWEMGPQGESPAPLLADPSSGLFNPSYSADGERIAFDRAAGDTIWTMNADGSNPVQLTQESGTTDDSSPSFFPNGRIAFSRGFDIWTMDADGSNQAPVLDDNVDDTSPSVSPDGASIVFTREIDAFNDDVFVINADGTGLTNLTNTTDFFENRPSYSPNGERIVFDRTLIAGGNAEVWVMSSDGSNPLQLAAPVSAQAESPVFSPDGTRIAYFRYTMDGGQIWTMSADGQNQAPLIQPVPNEFYASPDWQALNAPAIDATAGKQKSPNQVTVSVVSQNENATATLDGTLKAPKPKPRASASKKKTVELDSVTVQLEPGVPVTADIPVAGKGKKLIKKSRRAGKKPKGTVTVAATDDLGAAASDSTPVKYKKKK
jgi:Tol biopolymer transport system component